MKTHHVWWPHLDRSPIFNPFIPTTNPRSSSDRIELPDIEDEEGDEELPVQPEDRSPADK
jgi:hypothetical protein